LTPFVDVGVIRSNLAATFLWLVEVFGGARLLDRPTTVCN
jgi:hypothetical protein